MHVLMNYIIFLRSMFFAVILSNLGENTCYCQIKPKFCQERSGSVVECLTRDHGAEGSSLTGVTVLCPSARHIYPSLVLVQPRKTRSCLTERLLMGRKESNKKIPINTRGSGGEQMNPEGINIIFECNYNYLLTHQFQCVLGIQKNHLIVSHTLVLGPESCKLSRHLR